MKSTTLFAYGKINVDAIRICISNEFKPKCVRCSIETRPKQKWYTQHHFDTFYSRENRYQSLIIWAASWERRPKKKRWVCLLVLCEECETCSIIAFDSSVIINKVINCAINNLQFLHAAQCSSQIILTNMVNWISDVDTNRKQTM